MQTSKLLKAVLRCGALALCTASFAAAQENPQAAAYTPRAEAAVTYEYVHSNAPEDTCGCFGINGGAATFAWPIHNWALVADVASGQASNINGAYDLTLTTFTAGGRYQRQWTHGLRPYGQVLAGFGHASGSLDGDNGFAANVGGGMDLGISRHVGVRLFEADYLLTTFNNGDNNHQNNLRINTGLIFRF